MPSRGVYSAACQLVSFVNETAPVGVTSTSPGAFTTKVQA